MSERMEAGNIKDIKERRRKNRVAVKVLFMCAFLVFFVCVFTYVFFYVPLSLSMCNYVSVCKCVYLWDVYSIQTKVQCMEGESVGRRKS